MPIKKIRSVFLDSTLSQKRIHSVFNWIIRIIAEDAPVYGWESFCPFWKMRIDSEEIFDDLVDGEQEKNL